MNVNTNYNFYSSMFNSLNNKNSNTTNNMVNIDFSEHELIKSGHYLTLAKAVYGKNPETPKSDVKELTEAENNNITIANDAESLENDSVALQKTGVNSLFNLKDIETTNEDGTITTTKGYDMDAITDGVKSFISSYNDLLTSGVKSSNQTVLSRVLSLTTTSENYENALAKVGITVGKDNKLSIDEEKFKKADINDIKNLFHKSGSYASEISRKADYINFSANIAKSDSKSNSYDKYGNKTNIPSTGDLMDELF